MPSSPVSKHNGLANGIDNIARLDTEEKKQLLLAAAKKGNLQTFVALHQADASLLWCDNRGYTVLHLAAKHGHKEIVKHIIANGKLSFIYIVQLSFDNLIPCAPFRDTFLFLVPLIYALFL
ncbi:histone-lysine N-methyltransferase EHMT1-like [Rhopilema esculentum]|uniref:histone-lysine N-methyltransferase EHMT1-like n=1 Tax=Rhopilema esculentum TaxID=499914 RepID=UPI0031E3BFA1